MPLSWFERGLIKVRRSKADKRRKVVSITGKAVKVYVEILSAVNGQVLSQFARSQSSGEL